MARFLTLFFALLALLWAAAASAKQPEAVRVTSPAFTPGGSIPGIHTCNGGDKIPPLVFSKVPRGTKTLALIMEDPDAPAGIWTHWVIWNVPADTADIAEGRIPTRAVQGRNSWMKNAYVGPCPPSGTHRYFFRVFALDTALTLSPSTTANELRKAMQGHTLAQGELVGTYSSK